MSMTAAERHTRTKKVVKTIDHAVDAQQKGHVDKEGQVLSQFPVSISVLPFPTISPQPPHFAFGSILAS